MGDPFGCTPSELREQLLDLGGEEVTYLPGGGGAPRRIVVLVDRSSPGATNRQGLPAPKARITAIEDGTYGIVRDRLNVGSQCLIRIPYPGVSSAAVDLPLQPDMSPIAVNDGGLCSYEV